MNLMIASIGTGKMAPDKLNTSLIHRVRNPAVDLSTLSRHSVGRFLSEAKRAYASSSFLNYLRLNVSVRHGPRRGHLLESCFGQLTSPRLGV